MPETEVALVKHYFDKAGVAAIEMTTGTLSVGDTIHITGHTTDVTAAIDSMQIEHEAVTTVKKGDMAGIKVPDRVREHDKVFKVTE